MGGIPALLNSFPRVTFLNHFMYARFWFVCRGLVKPGAISLVVCPIAPNASFDLNTNFEITILFPSLIRCPLPYSYRPLHATGVEVWSVKVK